MSYLFFVVQSFSLYKTTPQTIPSNTTKIFILAKTMAGESLSKICALTYRAMFENLVRLALTQQKYF